MAKTFLCTISNKPSQKVFQFYIYLVLYTIFFKTVHTFEWKIPDLPKFNLNLNVKCYFKECCDRENIPLDFNKLEQTLKTRVYGQHLIGEAVDALRDHYRYKSQKALTLSFHGWPGGGKNYVSKFIAESLFKYGTKSVFVHHFIGRMHFPLGGNVATYQRQLYSWLKGNITECPNQLFIFDEVDKMPDGVLNAIKPLIDYRDVVDGVDYSAAVFIFLSNTGSHLINEMYHNYWENGRSRTSLTIADFEKMIQEGAFNEQGSWLSIFPYIDDIVNYIGGFFHSDTISSNLIDHYIPFLPLEREHVRKCIRDEFRQRDVDRPSEDHVEEVLSTIEFGPESLKMYSKTGCKRVSQKVGLIVSKHYRKRDDL